MLSRNALPEMGNVSPLKSVAIIGISCCFPGGIEGKAMFWDSLVRGHNHVAKVPLRRLSAKPLTSILAQRREGRSGSEVL